MSAPRIISVANSKGGVGKSVVTIMLAVAIAKEKKKKVLIIDCDSQGSVTEMYNHEMSLYDDDPAIEVEELTPRKVQTFLKRFGNDYDYIFIDVPRMTDKKKDNSTVMLLYNCDSILVPIIGSEVDVLSSMDFLQILKEAKADKSDMDEELKYYGFINRRNLRKSNEEAEINMKKAGMKMFKHSLPDLRILTTPSFYKSVLDSAEGERRFRDFFKEFCRKFKIK
ncbi:MAG: ParA family protein [Bacteroidota bacterium]